MLKEWRRPTLAFATAILLSGCAATRTVETVRTVSDYCLWAFPISYSRGDTLETIGQVQAHNARHDAICPADAP